MAQLAPADPAFLATHAGHGSQIVQARLDRWYIICPFDFATCELIDVTPKNKSGGQN